VERKRYFRKFASPMITKRSFWGHLVELVSVNYESSISQEEGEESAEKLTARESAFLIHFEAGMTITNARGQQAIRRNGPGKRTPRHLEISRGKGPRSSTISD